MKSKLVRWGVLVVATAALVSSAPADAGTEPPIDDDALDALRAEIPEGFPGERDLTEAREEYLRLVAIYGQTTQVGDFGTGSELTGFCGGYARSYDENGSLLDAVIDVGDNGPPIDLLDGGQAFTSDNPFKVDPRGIVQYYGFSPEEGDGPEDHDWFIKTSGISLDKGGDPNPELKNRNSGLVDLDKDLPVKFSAKIKVSGEMTSKNQPACVGKGYVDVIGNGLTDPVGIAGLALLAGGLFGLLFNSRPAYTYKS
jgi:hypothetical protein